MELSAEQLNVAARVELFTATVPAFAAVPSFAVAATFAPPIFAIAVPFAAAKVAILEAADLKTIPLNAANPIPRIKLMRIAHLAIVNGSAINLGV